MKTDRELLELAARAAGYELRWSDDGTAYSDNRCKGYWWVWNPLTDDGDALRLAVKLGMLVDVTSFSTTAIYYESSSATEKRNGDPYVATRRAIVRAAAAIGEEMK